MPTSRRPPRRKKPRSRQSEPPESSGGDAVTIAWTVSVTGVLIADLLLAASHLYLRVHPEGQPARLLEAVLLLAAAAMGAISLGLLPVVWRARRLKPPRGYVVFAVFVAAAPIAATLVRVLT